MNIGNANFSPAVPKVLPVSAHNVNIAAATASYSGAERSKEYASISETGRRAHAFEQAVGLEPNTSEAAKLGNAIKIYQIPSWYAEHKVQVQSTLGESLNTYEKRHSQFSILTSTEQKEYASRIQEHYQAVLKDNGIESVMDHYKKMILDKDFSESAKLQMEGKIEGDSILMAILAKLGKS